MNSKKRLIVLFSGFLINMSLGVLYSWSIFSLNLTEELQWTKTGRAYAAPQEWKKMIKSKEFIMLWIMFLSGAMGGLMIIGHLSKIAVMQLGTNVGFILVALTAISNASGRPTFGVISDKIGRARTMILLSAIQGLAFLSFARLDTFALLMVGAAVVTFTYGGWEAYWAHSLREKLWI